MYGQIATERLKSEAIWEEEKRQSERKNLDVTASFEESMQVLRNMRIPYDPRKHGLLIPAPFAGPEARETLRRWRAVLRIQQEEDTWMKTVDAAAERQRVDLERQTKELEEARKLHLGFLHMAQRRAFRWRKVGKPVQLAVRWKQKIHGPAPYLSLIG